MNVICFQFSSIILTSVVFILLFTIIVCITWVTFLSKAFGGLGGGHAFGWGWYDSPGHGGGPIGTQGGGGRIEGDIIINTKDISNICNGCFIIYYTLLRTFILINLYC